MTEARGFVDSTIGRKVIMAVTGAILFGFVLVHMLGNLQVYLGPEALNHYGVFLRELLHGTGIWVARAILLAAVVLHIWSATSLTLTSRRARPEGYRDEKWKESTYASRTMRWGGVILLLFIIYHVLHFTTGTVHQSFIEGDVYHNFVAGFQGCPGQHLLHFRDARARAAPAPRPVEHVPDPGRLPSALHPDGPRRGLDLRGHHRDRQHLLPPGGARRDREVA